MIKGFVRACTLTSILFLIIPFLLIWDLWVLFLQRALGYRHRHSKLVALVLAIISVSGFLYFQMGSKSMFSERFRSESVPPILSYTMQVRFTFLSLFEVFVISSLTALLSASCMFAKCVIAILTMPYICVLCLVAFIFMHLSV